MAHGLISDCMEKLLVSRRKLAIIGGGPSALFVLKKLIENPKNEFAITIFESNNRLGAGMPYSTNGANAEHVTNVSGNEIPTLVTSVLEWLNTLDDRDLAIYNIRKSEFTDFKVMPRLLFGDYLNHQFHLLQTMAELAGIDISLNLNSEVTDIQDFIEEKKVHLTIGKDIKLEFDKVIICTGHTWPVTHEGTIPGYYDSPYPPLKLAKSFNHSIALRGSSLTAIDAIRTLARANGRFVELEPHVLKFIPAKETPEFKIIMHSRHGLLPGIRFHLEDSHLKGNLLTKEQMFEHMVANEGFLSLDYLFEKNFKEAFRDKRPAFFAFIRDMTVEEFVSSMMELRERMDPFIFFKKEYIEAEKSIRNKESVYWKEMLAILSFSMNYPAKYLSAEDMQRLQKVLMPLISIVIAFVPQNSCEELIALHEAGCLEIKDVGENSSVEITPEGSIRYSYVDSEENKSETIYQTFVDGIGQKHLSLEAFPFQGLVSNETVTRAKLKFRSSNSITAINATYDDNIEKSENSYFLKVPGIAISDSFNALNKEGKPNDRIYIMAVPYIGGYNPDYSGLDFCEEASTIIVKSLVD